MATSSIEKNFVIKGSKQAEIFINALEQAEKARENVRPISAKNTFVEDKKECKNFLKKWTELYGNK